MGMLVEERIPIQAIKLIELLVEYKYTFIRTNLFFRHN